jgi:hypothetical protein
MYTRRFGGPRRHGEISRRVVCEVEECHAGKVVTFLVPGPLERSQEGASFFPVGREVIHPRGPNSHPHLKVGVVSVADCTAGTCARAIAKTRNYGARFRRSGTTPFIVLKKPLPQIQISDVAFVKCGEGKIGEVAALPIRGVEVLMEVSKEGMTHTSGGSLD